LAAGDDIVVGLGLLKHHPHRSDIFAGVAPVSACFEIAKLEFLHLPELDSCNVRSDLPSHEFKSAPRRLVVEENARRRVQTVGFAIVSSEVEPGDLGYAVGGSRMKRRLFVLRADFGLTEHLA